MEIQVPVIKEVDVLIIGGTLAGCDIALKLCRAARRVLVMCEGSALGTDTNGRLNRERAISEPLLRNSADSPVKEQALLDETLLNAGVEFLLDVIPLRPLFAASTHKLSGWFFFGRSGYFAISAKAVIDATFDGMLPYQMKLSRRSTALAECIVQWNAVGNCSGITVSNDTQIEVTLQLLNVNGSSEPLCSYKKSFKIRQNDLPAKLDAETLMRAEASGSGFCHGANWCTFSFTGPTPWNGIEPTNAMPLFRADSPKMPTLLQYTLPTVKFADAFLPVDHRHTALKDDEVLQWQCRYPRPGNYKKIAMPPEVLITAPEQETDVLILGAGTAGVEAASASASRGLRVLLLESGANVQAPLQQLLQNGVRVWHHCCITAVLMRDKTAIGALVANASGEACLVRSKVIIDATGYGIAASVAGAPTKAPQTSELVVPGTIVAPRMPSNVFGAPDGLLYAENDTMDSTRALIMDHIRRRHDFCGRFSSEMRIRPRIIGEITVMPQDLILRKCYNDSIAQTEGCFPIEEESCHPLLWLSKLCGTDMQAWIPYRALLPLKLEGVLILGNAVSVHKDVLPICNNNKLLLAEGRTAAIASEMSISLNVPLRRIPIRKLQRQLVDDGILPEQALMHEDGLAAPDASLLASIFHRPDRARRFLQAKFEQDQNLDTALILAFLGDSSGRDVISNAIKNCDIEKAQKEFCIMVEALAVIGGNSAVLKEKIRAIPADLPQPVLRSLARFFNRWPDRSAAPYIRKLLQPLLTTPLHTGLLEALDIKNSTEDLRLKMLYLAVALYECAPNDEDAQEVLAFFRQSWHLTIAILVNDTLKKNSNNHEHSKDSRRYSSPLR